jgi:hypothetical protein
MYKIVWTEPALDDYHSNIAYLLEEWSEKEAHAFISDVEKVLFQIQNGNVQFKETGYNYIRQCVVCKQISLYYRIIDEPTIELLRFWNNYQDRNNLKFQFNPPKSE